MTDEIELIYFQVQGRATLPRMLLRLSGCEWKDTRIPANKEAWAEQKPKFIEDALGAVPVLKLNGQGQGLFTSHVPFTRFLFPNKVFCQTEAIVDWAVAKAGLYSSDPVRRMKVFLKRQLEYSS